MKQDDLKKVIDGIIIPEQKLDMCLKSKKNPKRYYKFLAVPVVICLTIGIFSLRKDENVKETTNIDSDYFITNVYANEQNYNIEKPVQIDMTEDMFGTSWEVSSIINSDESGFNGKSYLPFDIVITGDNIKEEHLTKIWNRFYKVDESRNRDDGGTGIGLSFVKAIMMNYGNSYGVINKENGVEFYFDLDYCG